MGGGGHERGSTKSEFHFTKFQFIFLRIGNERKVKIVKKVGNKKTIFLLIAMETISRFFPNLRQIF